MEGSRPGGAGGARGTGCAGSSLQGNGFAPPGQGFRSVKGVGLFVDIKVADVAKGRGRDTIALEYLAAGGSGGALGSRGSLQPRRPLRTCGTGCPFGACFGAGCKE